MGDDKVVNFPEPVKTVDVYQAACGSSSFYIVWPGDIYCELCRGPVRDCFGRPARVVFGEGDAIVLMEDMERGAGDADK